MNTLRWFLAGALFALIPSHSMWAQVVIDGTALTLNGTATNVAGLVIGSNNPGSSLIVTNGGTVTNTSTGFLGMNSTSRTNRAIVTGTNSIWMNTQALNIGGSAALNVLVVTNAGRVISDSGTVGNGFNSTNNSVVVTGTNSSWSIANALNVGNTGGYSLLLVTNGATVKAANLTLGVNPISISNTLAVAGGNLIVTNASGTGLTDLRHGILRLRGGSFVMDQLLATNAEAILAFDHGDLTTLHGSTIEQTNVLAIGSTGNETARWLMAGGTNRTTAGGVFGVYVGQYGGQRAAITVTGASTVWSNTTPLHIGYASSSNQMSILNGAKVFSTLAYLGTSSGYSDNEVLVSGPGSTWNCPNVVVGNFAANCRVIVSNGGWLVTSSTSLGSGNLYPSNGLVVVTGPGSVWRSGNLNIGQGSSSNSVLVADDALLTASQIALSTVDVASNNWLTVSGGNVVVTNASTNATIEVGRVGAGMIDLRSGLIRTDRFFATNGVGSGFSFSGGTLRVARMRHGNGSTCAIGNGSNAATLELLDNNPHLFGNGLLINSNALLSGSGSITGNVTVAGILSPGTSIGKFSVVGTCTSLPGSTNYFELNKSAVTNDNLTANSLVYGGTLLVNNLSGALASGDSFKLFTAPGYSGVFTNLQLPALDPGLFWTNKLSLNGTLEVMGTSLAVSLNNASRTATGAFRFGFTNTPGNPCTVFTTTNLSWPMSSWSNLGPAIEILPGQFQFTDNQATNSPQRFYRVRNP